MVSDAPTLMALVASAYCAVTCLGACTHAHNYHARILFALAAAVGVYLFYFYVRISLGMAVDTRVWLRPAGAALSFVAGSLGLYEWMRRRP